MVRMAARGLVVNKHNPDISFQMFIESPIEKWRFDTLTTKEPETLAWIDSMQPGEILYDIGANIGIYTLYAAARGIQVVAVEPVLENYVRLVENIELNHFRNVTPIYGACGYHHDGEMFTELFIPDKTAGATGAQLSDTKEVVVRENSRTVPIYNLDDFLGALGLQADHIKVDVDGQEKRILLSYNDLFYAKSVLVEINPDQWPLADAIRSMTARNFLPDSLFNHMSPHSSERRQREGIKVVNMVFKKEV